MRYLLMLTLLAGVIGSAIEVVIVQHNARNHFIELQVLENTRDQLDEEWGRLQLEQSTWAISDRIENLARQELGMYEPGQAAQIFLMP